MRDSDNSPVSPRKSLFKVAISVFRRKKGLDLQNDGHHASQRAEDAKLSPATTRSKSILGKFSRKRKAPTPSPEPIIDSQVPLHLKFLFVGGHGCGQTSLL